MAALSLDPPTHQSEREEPSRPLIEVISSTSADRPDESAFKPSEELLKEREIFLEAAKNDWRLPQSDPSAIPSSSISLSTQRTYGFLDAYSGYFKHGSQSSPGEVNDLGELAEMASDSLRDEMRSKREEDKFHEEYYMADFVNAEEINEHIAWKSPYAGRNSNIEFSEEENAVMLKLPRKEYIPTPAEIQTLYLTLITILFSYSYDTRTTQHDPTPESAWTIAILTPAMSSLTSPQPSLSPLQALVSSYRRALSFPLYRSYALCEAVRKDVADILSGGRRAVTRALLAAKSILDGHDVYYVYGKIWVDDFLVWIMGSSSDEALKSLGDSVRKLEVPKSAIGWPLEGLEEAALTVEDDE